MNTCLFFSREETIKELLAGKGLEGIIYNDDTPLNWENHNCEYFS
jgi:hypothetical protein